MSAAPETTYVDCLADFQAELAKLSTWDLRCLANINKENFISVTEACDPKTDAMVGWEKCTTLKGLVAKKAIPAAEKLSDAEMINLFDNLLAREFATLDGHRIMLGPFACVYLHDVEGLCKENDAVYFYVKSLLASTNLLYSICAEANVLENEEMMFQCHEILGLAQGIDIEAVIAGLKSSAEKTANADLKLRLELRAAMLKNLLTLYIAHSTANAEVEAALTDAAQIAADIRSKILTSRAKLGAITTDAKLFPDDVRYWLTTNTTTSSTEPDLVAQIGKVADFFAALAGFTAFAACKNFFEIAVIAEQLAIAAPCVLTRPFAYQYIFRDRPTEQPSRVARGDRLLGDKSLRMAILKYLENDLGAPLYFQLLDSSVAPMTNIHLQDVAHYAISCSNGLSGVKTPATQLAMVQQQVLQNLYRWLDMAAVAVADTIQSALFNTGRHQRRVANRLTDLNTLHAFAFEVDNRLFMVRAPTMNPTDIAQAREQVARASVLTAFAVDLICDSMEKFVRLTMRLGLPTKPEFAACTWYLELIATTRLEHVQSLTVKASEKGSLIPERKVNKKTGNPLACPALTSRLPVAISGTVYARADVARQIAEVSFLVFALMQSHNIVTGYESAVGTSLTTAEQMFDHRFAFLSRVRFPSLPPFSACASRLGQLKAISLFRMISSTISMSGEISEIAKSHVTEAETSGSVFAADLTALEKSARALTASMRLLRSLIFPAETTSADVANPSAEDIAKALGGYEITLETPYDKSVVIPVLRKKSE